MKPTIYLDKRRDVKIMRRLQRMKRLRRGPVVIRHQVFADAIGCSVSTLRRSINALVEAGHIRRTHISRPTKGGYLCVYDVRTDVIYRVSSLVRRATRAIEQLRDRRKHARGGHLGHEESGGSKSYKDNQYNNNRPSDGNRLSDLLMVARAAGINDQQRGFLRAAAIRFGVIKAWNALVMAFERGYSLADVVKVTWGILKRQEGLT